MILERLKKSMECAPYEQIAAFYDHLMAHVEYNNWAEYISRHFKRSPLKVRTVLEGGCGTGSMLQELQKRGYAVAGYDLSHAMVSQARGKGLQRVWQGDMQYPSTRSQWDCMLSLYDTIHYLKEKELSGFFKAAHNVLNPGGLLIFDAVTLALVHEYWMDFTERDFIHPFEYVRHSYYESGRQCQHTEFKIWNRTDGRKMTEHHLQWIYPISTYIRTAEQSGFMLTGVFDNCTMDVWNEDSERVHIVLQKGDA